MRFCLRHQRLLCASWLPLLILFVVFCGPAPGVAEKADASKSPDVGERLRRIQCPYELSQNGSFAICDLLTPNDRNQGVLVATKVVKLDIGKFLLLRSAAHASDKQFSTDIAFELLRSNDGAENWMFAEPKKGTHVVMVQLLVPLFATDDELKAALVRIANAADAFEAKHANGADDL